MALPLHGSDTVPLFGALVGYLALFDIATLDSDLVFVSIGVVVGYVGARVAAP